MAWQDRPYYRDRSDSAGNPLMWFLTGSVPLFTVFGVRVRAHASMLIFIALTLLFAESKSGLGAKNAVVSSTMLFAFVLLHEFGHVFAARWVGGSADDILIWPLGGLAMTDPPRRPWPSFLTTAGGPAVNLAICIITGTAICVIEGSIGAIPWLPMFKNLREYVPSSWTTYYLWWVFLINYGLLAFNMLLVFYPFDAGRMIQELLWMKVGYYKSMRFATVFGMVGAVLAAMVGLALGSLMIILIAAFGFYTCYRQRQVLLAEGPWGFQEEDSGVDYSKSLYDKGEDKASRKSSQRAARKAERIAKLEVAEQARIDVILDKVSAHGMHSLTWFEKRALHKATEAQKKRDAQRANRRRGI
jgi:stage IV sporulation protein FB